MKLIFSITAVPSATLAHAKSAWIGPPHSSTAASMLARSRRSRLIALAPASVTGAKSITTTSAPRSCTSSAVAAPMPVAPPTTNARLPSYRNASARINVSCRLVPGIRALGIRLVLGAKRLAGPSAGLLETGERSAFGEVLPVVIAVHGILVEQRAHPCRSRLRLRTFVVARGLVGSRDVGIDDAEVGDDQVPVRLGAVGEDPQTHVPHDVGGRLVAVPLAEDLDQLTEPLGIGAAHRDGLREIPVHSAPPLRSA